MGRYWRTVRWSAYPSAFKDGTFIARRTVQRPYTPKEIEELPPRHEARKNPDLVVERSRVSVLDMPPFSRVSNRVGVLFHGQCPVVAEEASS